MTLFCELVPCHDATNVKDKLVYGTNAKEDNYVKDNLVYGTKAKDNSMLNTLQGPDDALQEQQYERRR